MDAEQRLRTAKILLVALLAGVMLGSFLVYLFNTYQVDELTAQESQYSAGTPGRASPSTASSTKAGSGKAPRPTLKNTLDGVSQPPANFKGPTGAPHIKGPSNPPPETSPFGP